MSESAKITSTKNPLVRRFEDVSKGREPSSLLVDGLRLVEEALEAGLQAEQLAWSERLTTSDPGRALLHRLRTAVPSAALQECGDNVLQRLSHLVTHQGVVGVFRCPAVGVDAMFQNRPLLVVADGIQDPGNLGALLRSAEAAGATGFVSLAGSADPFRDKAVRGSAGSVFRLPCWAGATTDEFQDRCAREGIQVHVARHTEGDSYWDVDFRQPSVLVFGAEGRGRNADHELTGKPVRIPMQPPVESLNVAVAAGILLFEARRQRLG